MAEITFASKQARRIYNRALKRTSEKKRVKKLFIKQASLDGKSSLSAEEAKQSEALLNHYDRTSRYRLGIYDVAEIRNVEEETEAALEATKLFNEAFKHKYNPKGFEYDDFDVDNNKLNKLRNHISTTAKKKLFHPKLTEIARRINPDLDEYCHILIFRYEAARNKGEKAKCLQEIVKHIKSNTFFEIDEYRGYESTNSNVYLKQLNAFQYALESVLNGNTKKVRTMLGEYALEAVIPFSDVLRDNSFLSLTNGGVNNKKKLLSLIVDFKKHKGKASYPRIKNNIYRNKKTLLSIIEDAYISLNRAPIGNQNKIDAYRRVRILGAIALACGVRSEEIQIRMLTLTLPGINVNRELSHLAVYWRIIDTPEKIDDSHIRSSALKDVKRVSYRLFKARANYLFNPNAKEERVLLSTEGLFNAYVDSASRLGASLKQIRKIISSAGLLKPPASREYSFQEIKAKGVICLSPKNLPKNVVEILNGLGIYEDIKKDIINIYFSREVNNSFAKRLIGGEGGHALPILQTVWADVIDASGKEEKPWRIASVIIHEWLHVKWGLKHFDNKELLRSIPNERNSFLGEAQFMKVHLKKLISRHKKEISEYESLFKAHKTTKLDKIKIELSKKVNGVVGDILNLAASIGVSQSAGISAGRVLGYKKGIHYPRIDLPKDSDELDLDVYPTNLLNLTSENIRSDRNRVLFECGYHDAKELSSISQP